MRLCSCSPCATLVVTKLGDLQGGDAQVHSQHELRLIWEGQSKQREERNIIQEDARRQVTLSRAPIQWQWLRLDGLESSSIYVENIQ